MAKFKGKYRIESARLKGYDYSSEGSYFITICAHKMQHFFGNIANEKMHLNEIGKLAEKFWKEIPEHFPHAILDEFIIMPNHMHGIITLIPKKPNVQTSHCDSIPNTETPSNHQTNAQTSHCDSKPNTESPKNLETNVQTSHCDVSLNPPNEIDITTTLETTHCDVLLNPPNEIDITTTLETTHCDVSLNPPNEIDITTTLETTHCDGLLNPPNEIDITSTLETTHCDVSLNPPNEIDITTTLETSHCDGLLNPPNEIDITTTLETTHCDVLLNPPNEIDITTTLETTHCDVSTKKQKMAAIRPKPGSLSVIIGSYKSVVSKHAHKISKNFEWQERFHDRIIRDTNEFARIANYIRNNPNNWKDEEIFL